MPKVKKNGNILEEDNDEDEDWLDPLDIDFGNDDDMDLVEDDDIEDDDDDDF